jgi:hypothetical protein
MMDAMQLCEVPAPDRAVTSNRVDRDSALNQALRDAASQVKVPAGNWPRCAPDPSPVPPAWWIQARARLLTMTVDLNASSGIECLQGPPGPVIQGLAAGSRADIDAAVDPAAAQGPGAGTDPKLHVQVDRRKSAGTAYPSGVERRASHATRWLPPSYEE